MERLARDSLRAVLGFLRENYAVRTLDVFSRHVISGASKILPSDVTTYNEIDLRRLHLSKVWEPAEAEFPGSREILERYIPEHPLIAYRNRAKDGRAVRISDLLSQHQFHRLGLYNEFHRPLGLEHVMSMAITPLAPLQVAIALGRSRTDFPERERLIADLLRPHLTQAYRNAAAFSRMRQGVAQHDQMMSVLGSGAIRLTREGRVEFLSGRAGQWMAEYFGGAPGSGDRLPDRLEGWVKHQESSLAVRDDLPPPRLPLVVEREGKCLVARLLSAGAHRLILLEERGTGLQPATLENLGLTRREAEVLAWVAQGKTNLEIGTILDARPRTVAKHLERICRKLGVQNRTAAAAIALTASSRD